MVRGGRVEGCFCCCCPLFQATQPLFSLPSRLLFFPLGRMRGGGGGATLSTVLLKFMDHAWEVLWKRLICWVCQVKVKICAATSFVIACTIHKRASSYFYQNGCGLIARKRIPRTVFDSCRRTSRHKTSIFSLFFLDIFFLENACGPTARDGHLEERTTELQQYEVAQPGAKSPSAPRTEVDMAQVLPPGWEQGQTPDGRAYFVNHATKETTWNVSCLISSCISAMVDYNSSRPPST